MAKSESRTELRTLAAKRNFNVFRSNGALSTLTNIAQDLQDHGDIDINEFERLVDLIAELRLELDQVLEWPSRSALKAGAKPKKHYDPDEDSCS